MNKLNRNLEKSLLKKQMNELLKQLGISKKFFLRNMPLVVGSGYNAEPAEPNMKDKSPGKKASLKQQVSFLRKIVVLDKDLKEVIQKEMQLHKNKKEK